jgi:hypothetical protein
MAAYRVVFRRQDSFKHSLGFFSHGRGEVFRYKTPQKPLQEKPLNEIASRSLAGIGTCAAKWFVGESWRDSLSGCLLPIPGCGNWLDSNALWPGVNETFAADLQSRAIPNATKPPQIFPP